MRVCRFDGNRLGVVEGDRVFDVTAALDALPPLTWPLPPGDPLYAHFDAVLERARALVADAPSRPVAEVAFDAPVAMPGKIIAAPVNYHKHIEESRADAGINFGSDVKAIDHYGVFLKASSSLIGPSAAVVRGFPDRRVDHELELALVIGRGGRNIARADALSHVAGYTMGLDMTVRGTEDRSYRKSADTYTVLGPWLVTADEIPDPDSLGFELTIGGESRQKSNTSYLIFGVARLIEYASAIYTLHPGDVILTGTPEGVGPVAPGDRMVCTMDGIGTMTVAVA